MEARFEMTGVAEVLQQLQQLPQALAQAGQVALLAEGNAIMGQSQRLVPVLSGLLRSTGAVRPEDLSPIGGSTVTLSYGGNGLAPYAAVVHERTDVHHPIGTHHYLSQPFYEATAGMAERLAEAIAHALRG